VAPIHNSSEKLSITLDTSANSTDTASANNSGRTSSTMMDVLPLVLLLVMGVVISSTCGKYASSEPSSTASESAGAVVSSSSSLSSHESQAEMAANKASIGGYNDDKPQLLAPAEQTKEAMNASPLQYQQLIKQHATLSSIETSDTSNQLRLSSLLSANNPSIDNINSIGMFIIINNNIIPCVCITTAPVVLVQIKRAAIIIITHIKVTAHIIVNFHRVIALILI